VRVECSPKTASSRRPSPQLDAAHGLLRTDPAAAEALPADAQINQVCAIAGGAATRW
jgi:hypothetical protein